MTKDGVAEFAYIMGTYGYNSPISSNDGYNLPVCESDGNGYYLSVGCSSSGTFTIDRFTDQYCMEYYDTYDKLKNFNYAMKSLSSCYNVYSSRVDEDVSYSLANYLMQESGTCSVNESEHCTTTSFVKNSGSKSARVSSGFRSSGGGGSTLSNQLKYGLGSVMLVGSVIMFFGILFTNRKKRRAMMHRKYRKSSDKKRSKSSRGGSSGKKRSSSSGRKNSSGVFA